MFSQVFVSLHGWVSPVPCPFPEVGISGIRSLLGWESPGGVYVPGSGMSKGVGMSGAVGMARDGVWECPGVGWLCPGRIGTRSRQTWDLKGVGTPFGYGTWDSMGSYGWQAGDTHPTGMLSCFV